MRGVFRGTACKRHAQKKKQGIKNKFFHSIYVKIFNEHKKEALHKDFNSAQRLRNYLTIGAPTTDCIRHVTAMRLGCCSATIRNKDTITGLSITSEAAFPVSSPGCFYKLRGSTGNNSFSLIS